MGKAVAEVFAEAWHGLCTFHIMQNAIKHLHEDKDEEKEKGKKKQKKKTEKEMEKNESTSILSDFSDCMFEYEDMTEFEQKFDLMR
jgi:zinc finger SWIM domain-containing protein 3